MDKLNDRIWDIIKNEINNSEYIRNMDLTFVEYGSTYVIGKIPFTDKIKNTYGTVHGGMLYSLADTVAGCLACSCGTFCTTLDGSMNFFEPATNTEYIYCKAILLRDGHHIVNVKVEIMDDNNKLLDDGSFNYFKIKGAKLIQD